jgi:hypothetical protein
MDDNKPSSSTHSKSSKITRCVQKTSHYFKAHFTREGDCCERKRPFANLGGKRLSIDWSEFQDGDLVALLAQEGKRIGRPENITPSPMHVIWAEKLERCADKAEESAREAGMDEVETKRRHANVVDWYANEVLGTTVEYGDQEEEDGEEEAEDEDEDDEEEDKEAANRYGPKSVVSGARDSLEVTRFWYQTGVLKTRKKKGPVRKLVRKVF